MGIDSALPLPQIREIPGPARPLVAVPRQRSLCPLERGRRALGSKLKFWDPITVRIYLESQRPSVLTLCVGLLLDE